MKTPGKIKEDWLREYIVPENIERAPEGFSSKVMTRVRMEPAATQVRKGRIPLISVAVISVFIAAAALAGGKWLPLPEISFLNDTVLPSPAAGTIAGIKMPHLGIYIIAGLVMLTLLDGLLRSIFTRGRKKTV